MQSYHIGFQTRGFYRVAHRGTLWAMTPKDAQERLARGKIAVRRPR